MSGIPTYRAFKLANNKCFDKQENAQCPNWQLAGCIITDNDDTKFCFENQSWNFPVATCKDHINDLQVIVLRNIYQKIDHRQVKQRINEL